MNEIHVLDCTLRDGGYCNQWEFGCENIKSMILSLTAAHIDIIECGYLSRKVGRNRDKTIFAQLDDAATFFPENCGNSMFVLMMNWDEYDIGQLPYCNNTRVDGIRVAFHKKYWREGLKTCAAIQEKGYKVFVQAMVSLNYNDREFLDLMDMVNQIKPYAFYIVDSFGVMKKKALMHMLYAVDKNLNEDIWIGFHSHNNLQLAYANAQSLVDMPMKRNVIIDASVYGMGRGAGNLNTELFVDYLNENYGKKYKVNPLLEIIDERLNTFYAEKPWGYTLPNYLSAVHNIHPNYALFLDEKKTLTFRDMDKVFSTFGREEGVSFSRNFIEEKYYTYLDKRVEEGNKNELSKILDGKDILLIAPGKSSLVEKEKIFECATSRNVVTISVNFDYDEHITDFVFLSNLRRYRELEKDVLKKCIVTSNIPAENAYLKIGYRELLNENKYVRDNAGLLLLKFLMNYKVGQVFLAGFDGYAHDETQNYALHKMQVYRSKEVLDEMNKGMGNVIREYANKIKITFLTKSEYIKL